MPPGVLLEFTKRTHPRLVAALLVTHSVFVLLCAVLGVVAAVQRKQLVGTVVRSVVTGRVCSIYPSGHTACARACAHQGHSAHAHQGHSAPAHQGHTAPAHQGHTAPAHQGHTAHAHQGHTAHAHQGHSADAHQGHSTHTHTPRSQCKRTPRSQHTRTHTEVTAHTHTKDTQRTPWGFTHAKGCGRGTLCVMCWRTCELGVRRAAGGGKFT